ncbi:MAG: DUF3299 domain-containing protein [Alphaproteobacteria bacterium]|nr:DUF3299 domain-containing protein [Alphaproteobacteria bacterium]
MTDSPMTDRRTLLTTALLAAAGAAVPALPAHAIETKAMPLDQHGYKPANALAGTVPWQMLATTDSYEKVINGFTWVLPKFPPKVRELHGKVVRVNGYMMPLDTTEKQSRFLLMAYPQTCPYCLSVGSQYFIEVLASTPVTYSQDAMVIEGRMELLEQDENGLYYRMRAARQVKA